MTKLSPAAQAVLDAFENSSDGEYVEGVWVVNERTMLFAALRAAAEILAEDQMDHYAPDLIKDIATEIEAEETASVSVKKQRPARLVAGDIWEFEMEVMVKGKRKPQDVTLQWVVKGYHPGECAWQLQSLDGQHYVYLWEHAPQYEEMTYIGTQNNA
jgi:hypothetical protein